MDNSDRKCRKEIWDKILERQFGFRVKEIEWQSVCLSVCEKWIKRQTDT